MRVNAPALNFNPCALSGDSNLSTTTTCCVLQITSVENYQDSGVVFQGNVRGKDIAEVYKKMQERLLVRARERIEM